MKNYELVVLLHPDLEIDADNATAKVEKLITGPGGKVLKRDSWGKRRLAYPVKKHDFAVYVYFVIQLDGGAVAELERSLGITEEVIRHLLVVAPEVSATEKKQVKAAAGAKEE